MLRPLVARRATQGSKPDAPVRHDRPPPPRPPSPLLGLGFTKIIRLLRSLPVPPSPTTTIPYAAYPHIVEVIFAQTDYTTKLKGRLLCWGVKAAVDRSLLDTSLIVKPRNGGRDFSIRSRAGTLPWFHPLGNRAAQLATMEETLELVIAGGFRRAPRLEYWLLFLGEHCVVRIAHFGAKPQGAKWTFVRPRRIQIVRNEYCSCGREGLRISHQADQVALTLRRLPITARCVLDAMVHMCQSNCAFSNGILHPAVKRLCVEYPKPGEDGSPAALEIFTFEHLRGRRGTNEELLVEIVQYNAPDADAAITRLQAAFELGVDQMHVTSINNIGPSPGKWNYWAPY